MAETQFTPGPWAWFGNAGSNSIYLATAHSGRRYVMGFRQWGMRGAQPDFQPAGRGMVPASKLATFCVGNRSVRGVDEAKANSSVYRLDINGIDCADARLIATSPCLLKALEWIDGEAPTKEPRDGPTVGFQSSGDPEDDDGNETVAEAFREGVARGLWLAAEQARPVISKALGK